MAVANMMCGGVEAEFWHLVRVWRVPPGLDLSLVLYPTYKEGDALGSFCPLEKATPIVTAVWLSPVCPPSPQSVRSRSCVNSRHAAIFLHLQSEVWGFILTAQESHWIHGVFLLTTMWPPGTSCPGSYGARKFLVPDLFREKSHSFLLLMCDVSSRVPTGGPTSNPIKWNAYWYTGWFSVF